MTRLQVTVNGRSFEVALGPLPPDGERVPVVVDGVALEAILPQVDRPLAATEWLIIDGRPCEIVIDAQLRWIRAYSGLHQVEVRDLDAAVNRPRSRDGRVKAPIPGLVTRVLVQTGSQVTAGEPVLLLEAMKMENEIRAPRGGRVTDMRVKPGQAVARDEVLAEIE